MTEAVRQQIREALAKATKAPWRADTDYEPGAWQIGVGTHPSFDDMPEAVIASRNRWLHRADESKANAELICLLRNHAAELLSSLSPSPDARGTWQPISTAPKQQRALAALAALTAAQQENARLTAERDEAYAEAQSNRAAHDRMLQQLEHRTLTLGAAEKRTERAEADTARLREALETAVSALEVAWDDLHEWRRLAQEQRRAHPDPNHAPNMPHEAGIRRTQGLIDRIGLTTALLRDALATAAPIKETP